MSWNKPFFWSINPNSGESKNEGCPSKATVLNAPDGFVFVVNSLSGGEVSGNGKSHSCSVGWDKWIEIIPGVPVTQPTVITLTADAASPSGMDHRGQRGWEVCNYTVSLTKYTK